MKYKAATVQLAQSVVNMITAAVDWEDEAFLKALELGIQGEKRKNRYEGTKDTNIRKYLQSAVYGVYLIPIHTTHISVNLSNITDPESFFVAYLEKLWEWHDALHEAANAFVVNCARKLSKPLYERAECIWDEIEAMNRRIARGRVLGWGHDLMIYETSWENVHDEYECKEKEIGYKF